MKALKVVRLSQAATLPSYAHPLDAGLDLHSAEDVLLRPGERGLVRTGIAIELPQGTEGQIRPRSGLALEHGVTILNSPGTVDAGFRGDISVLVINLGQGDFEIKAGMKIAQLVIAPVTRVEVQATASLAPSVRGSQGFGSTGS